MLSKGELQLFRLIAKINSRFYFLPIEWDSNSYKVKCASSRFRLCLNILGQCWTGFYFIFATTRVVPSYAGIGVTQPVHYTMIHVLLLVFHWYSLMVDLAFNLYRVEISECFNSLVSFNKDAGTVVVAFKVYECTYLPIFVWSEFEVEILNRTGMLRAWISQKWTFTRVTAETSGNLNNCVCGAPFLPILYYTG